MKNYLYLATLFLSVGCATISRGPSSVSSKDFFQNETRALTDAINQSDFFTSCPATLQKYDQELTNLNWDQFTNEELQASAQDAMNAFWQVRLNLHNKLVGMSKDCAIATRNIFHTMRGVEDYLGEFAYKDIVAIGPGDMDWFEKQPIPIYDTSFYKPYFSSQPIKGQFQFQPGDLMLARGISFISAIISQVSDNHSQYSHVVFLYKNPTDFTDTVNGVKVDQPVGVPRTIESYIGVGVSTYDINYALKNENARLLVLRPKDSKLGSDAADYMLKKTLAGDGHGGHIPYDYKMDFNDHSAESCAEVSRDAYENASNKKIILPTYPANISITNNEFLDKLGQSRGETFTPDDLEVDPNFDMVLDWRDYRLIRDSRHKDAILAAMINWIDKLGYNFHQTPKSFFAEYVVLPSRTTIFWPLVKAITGQDLDATMPGKTLGMMTVLDQIGQRLLTKVNDAENAFVKDHNRPMTNAQLAQTLEDIRLQDLAAYKAGESNLFHGAFRPDKVDMDSSNDDEDDAPNGDNG